MLTKKILVTILSAIFLSSCQSRQERYEGYQYAQVFKFEEVNGKKYINLDESFCRERKYEIGRDYIGSRGQVTITPIDTCLDVIGEIPSDYIRRVNFMEETRIRILQDETQEP